ncbi:MAG: ankyrin repeat domain-containing protein [Wolbachia sp.]
MLIKNSNGDTALHLAAKDGYSEIVQYLIEKDAAIVNSLNKYYDTSLLLAVKYDYLDIVAKLLENELILM